MPQAEKRPYRDWAAPVGYQAARSEVDGGDVVCVEGVAQAEGVGEDGGREELGVVVEEDGGDGPDEEVDGDEEGD